MTMMISRFHALPLDAQNLTQHSNLQLLQMGKTYFSGQDDNQTGCSWFCMGNRTSSTQHCRYVGTQVCINFGFYFISLKWTRTKITICVFGTSNGLSLSTVCTGVVWPLENWPCNSHCKKSCSHCIMH